MELSRYKRKAAAKVLLASFGILNTVANSTLALWPNESWDETFTAKEKRYLNDIRTQTHLQGERCRRLAAKLNR